MTAAFPFEHISIDTVGPFYDEQGEKWKILTIVDAFTRWPIAVPIKDEKTETVADALYTHVIAHHGVPNYIASDRASGFTSAQLNDLCKRIGTRKRNTSGLQPQANAVVERFHRYFNASISILCNKYGTDFLKYIDATLFSYRITTNATMGYSPFFLVYGREPRLPVDIIFGIDPGPTCPSTNSKDFVSRMGEVFRTVRERQARVQAANKLRRDNDRYEADYRSGDMVLVWEPPRNLNKEERTEYKGKIPKKLQDRWSPKLWTIVAPMGKTTSSRFPTLYKIRDRNGIERSTPVNVNRLKHFYPWSDDMPTTNPCRTDKYDSEFVSYPGKNVKIDDIVLIPTQVGHDLPVIVGRVIELGEKDHNGFRKTNIHFFGNNENDIARPLRPAWVKGRELSWKYKAFAAKRMPPKEGRITLKPKTTDDLRLDISSDQICAIIQPEWGGYLPKRLLDDIIKDDDLFPNVQR
jgi:transposase InsO family protein